MKYLIATYYSLLIFTAASEVNPSYLKFKLGEVIFRDRQEPIIQDSKSSDDTSSTIHTVSVSSELPTNTLTISMSNPTQTLTSADIKVSTSEQTSKHQEPRSTEPPEGISIWVWIGAGVGGVILLIGLAAGTFFGVIYCRHYLREKAIRDRMRQNRDYENNESGI